MHSNYNNPHSTRVTNNIIGQHSDEHFSAANHKQLYIKDLIHRMNAFIKENSDIILLWTVWIGYYIQYFTGLGTTIQDCFKLLGNLFIGHDSHGLGSTSTAYTCWTQLLLNSKLNWTQYAVKTEIIDTHMQTLKLTNKPASLHTSQITY